MEQERIEINKESKNFTKQKDKDKRELMILQCCL